ncbi:hypothetical protein DESC_720185 [Desulfosarcina cetonica]|nr:hypothetical protein DESC_720185 [Desulfosarcina cetonica]
MALQDFIQGQKALPETVDGFEFMGHQGDGDDGHHLEADFFAVQNGGILGNHPGGLQTAHTFQHGRRGNTDDGRQLGIGDATVGLQDFEDLLVDFVNFHGGRSMGCSAVDSSELAMGCIPGGRCPSRAIILGYSDIQRFILIK